MIKIKGKSAARGKRSIRRRRERALALLFWREGKFGLSDGGHREAQNLMAKGINPPGYEPK